SRAVRYGSYWERSEGLSIEQPKTSIPPRLHRMMRHGRIPGTPEGLHVRGKTKRDADIVFKVRITGRNEHLVGAQQLRHFRARPAGRQQDKIGLRIERAQHAGVGLIVEFLAIIGVAQGDLLYVLRI